MVKETSLRRAWLGMRLVSYTTLLRREAGTDKATTKKRLPFNRFRRQNEASDSMFSLLR